jgi:hypothetical protein
MNALTCERARDGVDDFRLILELWVCGRGVGMNARARVCVSKARFVAGVREEEEEEEEGGAWDSSSASIASSPHRLSLTIVFSEGWRAPWRRATRGRQGPRRAQGRRLAIGERVV